MVGFGSIGQGVLPLILRHIAVPAERITIVTAEEAGRAVAAEYGVKFIVNPLTQENFRQVLEPILGAGDFLLNLSVDVSSLALVKLAHEKGALYLDTCIEPWPGGYTDPNVPPSLRTNYALREQALTLRAQLKSGPTAVLTHGANPGLVSHFVKQALLNIAADTSVDANPKSREEWAALAAKLGVKVIHIAERDTQVANTPKKPNEFVNTWSVDGFVSEGAQPAELGWGTHEKQLPPQGRKHEFGNQCAIYLMQPGAATRVRTWTPKAGPFHGFLITHGEAISIPDYLSHREGDRIVHRPTVHYAYHPCDDAVLSVHEFAGRNWRLQDRKRILNQEILSGGLDELGVLLAGHKKNAYWFGSQLSIDEARKLAPHNTATSLQVCVAVLSGMVWALENPNRGMIEPDEMDFRRNLEICKPYLGPVTGAYSDWTPLFDRDRLFDEQLDHADPWQFKNVIV
jgi:homospermidine synthase